MRREAEFEFQIAAELRTLTFSEMSATSRWVMASLLAINGGAAAAVLGLEIPQADKVWPVAFFVAGIVLALTAALAGARINLDSIATLGRRSRYWLRVAEGGERVEEMEAEFEAARERTTNLGAVAQLPGLLALLAFIVGIAIAGISACS